MHAEHPPLWPFQRRARAGLRPCRVLSRATTGRRAFDHRQWTGSSLSAAVISRPRASVRRGARRGRKRRRERRARRPRRTQRLRSRSDAGVRSRGLGRATQTNIGNGCTEIGYTTHHTAHHPTQIVNQTGSGKAASPEAQPDCCTWVWARWRWGWWCRSWARVTRGSRRPSCAWSGPPSCSWDCSAACCACSCAVDPARASPSAASRLTTIRIRDEYLLRRRRPPKNYNWWTARLYWVWCGTRDIRADPPPARLPGDGPPPATPAPHLLLPPRCLPSPPSPGLPRSRLVLGCQLSTHRRHRPGHRKQTNCRSLRLPHGRCRSGSSFSARRNYDHSDCRSTPGVTFSLLYCWLSSLAAIAILRVDTCETWRVRTVVTFYIPLVYHEIVTVYEQQSKTHASETKIVDNKQNKMCIITA